MSEVTYPQKELKGLGGWLVLFQIQIWSNIAGAAQILIFYPIAGIILKAQLSKGYFDAFGGFGTDMYNIYFSPYIYIFAAVILVLTLLCIIFFYKKKLLFRVFFIIETILYIIGMCFYYLYIIKIMANTYTDMFGNSAPFTNVFTIFFAAVGILPMIGIAVAFIIALFKSKRVKNTFS